MLGMGIGSGTAAIGVGGAPQTSNAANLSGQAFGVFNTAAPVTLVPAAAGNAGTYRVSVYFVITTSFVTNTTEVITLGWTDDQGARTSTVSLTTAAGQNGALTQLVRNTGAAAITYTPSVTGTAATAGAAAFSVIAERLL